MFPARSLAEELLARDYRVALACDTRGQKYFDGLNSVQVFVLSSGTYKAGLKGKIGFVLPMVKGYFEAHSLIKHLQPAVAVGFGGYPSAPPLWAAQHRGIPTVLHEQNAILGLANQMLGKKAKTIALSLEETTGIKQDWHVKKVLTGNPVRAAIAALADAPYPDPQGKINLLITGGSQGAAVFSDVVPKAIIGLPTQIRSRLHIVHQARPDSLEDVRKFYEEAGISAELQPFFSDMPERIRAAHLVVSRSGASTIAELTTAGRPAIYVPYPWNRDNQQVFNAQAVVAGGGGQMIEEKNLTPHELTKALARTIMTPGDLALTAAAAKSLGNPEAAGRLADAVVAQIHKN